MEVFSLERLKVSGVDSLIGTWAIGLNREDACIKHITDVNDIDFNSASKDVYLCAYSNCKIIIFQGR